MTKFFTLKISIIMFVHMESIFLKRVFVFVLRPSKDLAQEMRASRQPTPGVVEWRYLSKAGRISLLLFVEKRTQKRGRGPAERNTLKVFCIRWAVLRLWHRKKTGTAATRGKILMIFPRTAAGIGSCKANSAPSFFWARVQEQPNLIQWLSGRSSLPDLVPFSSVYRQKKDYSLRFWTISTDKWFSRYT